MQRRLSAFIFVALGITALLKPVTLDAQDRFPANVTPELSAPYSLFIDDYTDPANNQLVANIIFNDFNEAFWTFRLALRIESADIQLTTDRNFIPAAPITVVPGELFRFTGEDWAEYFDYNVLNVVGPGREGLLNSGRLPEGFYSFFIQVLDYQTGEPLSQEIATTAWIQLSSPPQFITPQCEVYINPSDVQIPFTWQLFNNTSPNSQLGTEYQLTMWEITEHGANPLSAVENGQALQVFQSDILNTTSFIYGPAEPALEVGKSYVYRVQALDPGGRDQFRNNGYSEFCQLYYGWPTNNKIELLYPEEEGGFRKRELPYLKWGPLTRTAPGQQVNYHVEIAEMEINESVEDALNRSPLWLFYETYPTTGNYNETFSIPTELSKTRSYAWQIKAFSNGQEVGTSGKRKFFGPPLMEHFYAGIHRVIVDYVNDDINDFSGTGRVRLSDDPYDWTEVEFEHLVVEDVGGYFVLKSGEIRHTLDEPRYNTLKPRYEDNFEMTYEATGFKLNKDGLFLRIRTLWDLPLAALSTEKAVVKSNFMWAYFNDFEVVGAANLAPGNTFELLDPFSFTLSLDTTSLVYFNEGSYWFDFNGHVNIPDKVSRSGEGRPGFVFNSQEQVYYMEGDLMKEYNPIHVINSGGISMFPKTFHIDFSEKVSPQKQSSNPAWKGLYIYSYDLLYNQTIDDKGQISFTKGFSQSYSLEEASLEGRESWINTSGLRFKSTIGFEGAPTATFQTFPAKVNTFFLDIEENNVAEESQLEGDFLIPVISTTDPFDYVIPVNNRGFLKGHLTNLTGTEFIFNEGSGDQELTITVDRSVLAGNERVDMTLTVEWPTLGVSLTDLKGFRAWGDYSIGFGSKNGTIPLTDRLNSEMRGYPITMDIIGAGSSDGHYSFATTVEIQLGEDVSGDKETPKANVYSVVPNEFVPEGASGYVEPVRADETTFEQAVAEINKEIDDVTNSVLDALKTDQRSIVGDAESIKEGAVSGLGEGEEFDPDKIFVGDSAPPSEALFEEGAANSSSQFNAQQQELLYEIVSGLVEELTAQLLRPVDDKIDSINLWVKTEVNGLVGQVNGQVESSITGIVTKVADGLAKALQNDVVPLEGAMQELGDQIARSLVQEAKSAINKSVNDNILLPIETLLIENIKGRLIQHIVDNGTEAVYSALVGNGGGAGDALEGLVTGMPGVMKDIFRDAAGFVSLDNITSMVTGLGSDIVNNIQVDAIAAEMRSNAEKALKKALNDAAANLVSGVAEDFANDVLAVNVGGSDQSIDFVGAGTRLAKGDIKGVLAMDPVHVKLNTSILELDGYIQYTPEDPTFGDVWAGDIDMFIKVPRPFAMNATYINGRVDDLSYWFCQITPPRGDGKPYKIGEVIPKTAKPLDKPANIGIAEIVGASGRLYHHMSETPAGGIIPDANMKFGAFMHFVFYDINTSGKNLRLEVSGEINTQANGDVTVAFDGNLQLQSVSPNVLEPDENAPVQGTVQIRYNSAEKHFFGYAKVVLEKPNVLCAQGSLLVDVKPGKWRVALGSREERLTFVPGCVGWSPTGWLDLNQNVAELGVGVQWSILARTPSIPFLVFKVRFAVEAGLAFGILAAIQYRPNFALVKAGIWVDLYVKLIMEHKVFWRRKWKKVTLVDILLKGDLIIYFIPKPTRLEGSLRGHVKVLFFKGKVNASFSKEI